MNPIEYKVKVFIWLDFLLDVLGTLCEILRSNNLACRTAPHLGALSTNTLLRTSMRLGQKW